MNKFKLFKAAVMLMLLTVSTSVFAHTLQHDYLAHDLAHLLYGFNHMPVVYAMSLSSLLFALGSLFSYLAWRYARGEWLAAGSISMFAAGAVFMVAL